MQVRLLLTGLILTLLTQTAPAVDVFVSAAAGNPYSIASLEIPVDPPIVGNPLPPIDVSDAHGRVLYPIANDVRVEVGRSSDRPIPPPGRGRLLGRVGNLIRELTDGNEEAAQQTIARRVSFLIRGSEPIRIRIADSRGEIGRYEIVPQSDRQTHGKLMSQWWTSYTEAARRQIDAAEYPTLVESYLVAMLSSRVGMPLPDWYTNVASEQDELLDSLKLIAGAGGVAETMFRRAAAGEQTLAATEPLPAGPNWAPMFQADNLDNVAVEPLATRVPPECCYIRYGSFEDYLWFNDLSDEYGGDIFRMITLAGINDDATGRIERQLNLRTTAISRMLGGTIIEEQAIIARDMFMGDGASIGSLFQASNVFLLRTSLNTDRANLAGADKSVTLKDIKIANRPVSLLSSADNRVRSYLAEDGNFILVTNSREMVKRFFEVGETKQSLATTPAFRLARRLMPLEREDAIFAYFSPAMLRGLVAPNYLIELRRRMLAKSEIAMVHLARLAAAAEGDSITSIDELIGRGYLPQGFGQRADGSGVISFDDQVIDTLRGQRGTFLPIADCKVNAVTQEESDWYQQIAAQYSTRFPDIDPIMVGVQRSDIPDAKEMQRVTIHAEIAPWDPTKYGWWAKQLGPPTQVAMEFAPDDIVAVQAHVASAQLGPPTHLFAAVKDSVPPEPDDFDGILNIYRSLRQIPGYLGAWPQPGALDRLPLGLGRGQPVGPGMSRLIGGLYRYTGGGFSVLSFQQEILQASLPFMGAVDVEDSAQIRARVGNLAGSQIEGWVNNQLYGLTAVGSQAGADFLGLLSRQLKVAPEDALASTQQILGAPLQCTLGGEYEYSEASNRWTSTATRGSVQGDAPPGYVAPPMQWLRGANASVTQYEDRLVADAEIDIQRKPKK